MSYSVTPLVWGRIARTAWPVAAYRGCTHFGIEVFEPDTARTLLAAELVADLFDPPAAEPNPESLFASGACHSGLWRLPYEPRSLLTFAAAAGRLQRLLPV
ncbi:hypothetical protein [Nocardia wallacei]|uniref:hypothetical protein n=1 Tax=Nocardia wallacei TaxID=480035 RepID=UPI00245640A5|nr:hypothetical protein [Nocardia wallacei]